jgi:N6-L-threonylcarbamoyladenine synthase
VARTSASNRKRIWRAGFVDAAVDVLTTKSIAAFKQTGLNRLVVAGGVGANRQLREALSAAAKKRRFEVHYPDLSLCTDNGAMIALAGALRLARWPDQAVRDYAFTVKPRWDLTSLAAAKRSISCIRVELGR